MENCHCVYSSLIVCVVTADRPQENRKSMEKALV